MISRRAAILACLSMPMLKLDVLAATKHKHPVLTGGVLTVPLNDYAGIVVDYKGQRYGITSAEIFAALFEGEDT